MTQLIIINPLNLRAIPMRRILFFAFFIREVYEMKFNNHGRRFKSAIFGAASIFAAPAAMAATSGGSTFSVIATPLQSVLTGISDLGGLVAAGGLISTGLAWWHGGEHKKAMMIGLGATVAGVVMANASALGTSLTGGATMGNVSTFGLLAGHAVHLAGF